jgi:AcrR family transcriptional regulator
MSGRRARLELTAAESLALEQLVAEPSTPPRETLRARIVMRSAAGTTDREVAEELGVSLPTVALWRNRYAAKGLGGLSDRPRPGRPRVIASRAPTTAGGRRRPANADGDGGAAAATDGSSPDRADDSIEHLLQAACRTISKRGFASTRVADIAAEAGVSPATVHYHFRTRQEILVQALLWANARLVTELERATSRDDGPIARIAKFLERTIPYPGTQEDEYRLEIDLWGQARHHPELLGPYEEFAQRWFRQIVEMIESGVASGVFEISVPVEEIAERLVALTDGFAAQAVIGTSSTRRVRERVLRFAAEQLGVEVGELERHALVPELTHLRDGAY